MTVMLLLWRLSLSACSSSLSAAVVVERSTTLRSTNRWLFPSTPGAPSSMLFSKSCQKEFGIENNGICRALFLFELMPGDKNDFEMYDVGKFFERILMGDGVRTRKRLTDGQTTRLVPI